MFDISEFTFDNLVNGYNNGSFTAEQINIMAVNYNQKGILSTEQLEEISIMTKPIEEITESEESVNE